MAGVNLSIYVANKNLSIYRDHRTELHDIARNAFNSRFKEILTGLVLDKGEEADFKDEQEEELAQELEEPKEEKEEEKIISNSGYKEID